MAKNETIADRLRIVLEAHGLTMKSAAEKADMPYRSLQNYLSGTQMPGAEAIIALCNSLRMDPTWLLTGQGNPFGERRVSSEVRITVDRDGDDYGGTHHIIDLPVGQVTVVGFGSGRYWVHVTTRASVSEFRVPGRTQGALGRINRGPDQLGQDGISVELLPSKEGSLVAVGVPAPGAELLRSVRAGFTRQGSSLAAWCRDNGIARSYAERCLRGGRGIGSNGAALRQRIVTVALNESEVG